MQLVHFSPSTAFCELASWSTCARKMLRILATRDLVQNTKELHFDFVKQRLVLISGSKLKTIVSRFCSTLCCSVHWLEATNCFLSLPASSAQCSKRLVLSWDLAPAMSHT